MLELYFDAGHFWGDIAHVMALTFDQLDLYVANAVRILEAQKPD